MLAGTSGDHLVQPPCSSRVSWSRLPRTMSSQVLNVSNDGDATTSGQPVPMFNHSHSEVFSYVQAEFPVFHFVPIASLPVTGHHWEEPGCVCFTPSHRISINFGMIHTHTPQSLLFSRLSSPSCVSPFSPKRCSRPLIIFVALCWTRSCRSMCFFY